MGSFGEDNLLDLTKCLVIKKRKPNFITNGKFSLLLLILQTPVTECCHWCYKELVDLHFTLF